MLYVTEDTKKLPPSTLVSRSVCSSLITLLRPFEIFKGIYLLPEKVESIKNIPVLKIPMESNNIVFYWLLP